VGYESAEALEAALPQVAELYEQAGIEAWTVWVPQEDRPAADLLAGAGHVLDASPLAMTCAVEDAMEPWDVPEEWTGEADAAVLGPLNDRAYGYEGSFTRALDGIPGDRMRTWVAEVGAQPVTCLATIDQGADRHVILVATLPEFRGRGLAGGLLTRAIADARANGMITTSLIATRLGAPVYERLGYRSVGVIEMWERRRG
jgi:GNAT superfamily N-acetyltransferase